MKKLLLAFLAIAVLLAFVACDAAQVTTTIKIKDTAGAGSKTFSAKILKDDQQIYLGDEGKLVENNFSQYLIGGTEATIAKLKEICPIEGATVEAGESTDAYDTIVFSFSFDSIDDYNAKIKSLEIEGFPIAEAELVVDGDNVTFKEVEANQKNSIMWALDAIYNDSALFDNTVDTNVKNDSLANIYDVVVTIGDKTENLRYTKAEDKTEIKPNPDVEVTGNVAGAAVEEPSETAGEEPAGEESPKTADNGIVVFVAMMVIAGAALVVAKKRALN